MQKYKAINKCRICGNPDLDSVINLGNQFLTGVFPKSKSDIITSGPLELTKCREDKNANYCGLLQLAHSYDLGEMYGDNYGYRSGLNKSMIEHLNKKVKKILENVKLSKGDLIIDIGSNDGTLLKSYPQKDFLLVGMDPTGKKFKNFYPEHVLLIPDFFSSRLVSEKFKGKKAAVITSISMFYDLEKPMEFMKQIHEILADDGIWVFEQSYMPTMLEMNAYDTICHEHLEYYSLKQIKWMTDKIGLKIIDVELNNVNGGSFSITAAKKDSYHRECTHLIESFLREEKDKGLSGLKVFEEFKNRVYKHRDELKSKIDEIKAKKQKVFGYGASTKGNVILQFCGITEKDIPFIAEVNEDKFRSYTPGTLIPIISEKEAREMKPDYFLVLPWHFRENLIVREKEYLASGGKLLFPLPYIEAVQK